MFNFKLSPQISTVNTTDINFSDGTSVPLPKELRNLTKVTHQWRSVAQLEDDGLHHWQLVRLVATGLIDCGREDVTLPWRIRQYFEDQFPEHAKALPFTEWITRPAPSLVWIGLPHTNLVDLRHSTATGLAAVVDAMPNQAPIIGVLPEPAPNTRCAENLTAIARLAQSCGFKIGLIGGDHRATWSLLSVLKQSCGIESVCYIHIDAHHDLYGIEEKGESNGIYHSNFLADLLKQQHVDQVRLLGCRDCQEPVLHAQRNGYDVDWIESIETLDSTAMHTHLSIDIDVLDPAQFGGVSSPLDDGWSLDKLLHVLSDVVRAVPIDSASIVEAGSNCPNTVKAVVKLTQFLEKCYE